MARKVMSLIYFEDGQNIELNNSSAVSYAAYLSNGGH
jgi:hypothetical protein